MRMAPSVLLGPKRYRHPLLANFHRPLLQYYGRVEMQKHQQEFCSSTGDEESKFWELFEPTAPRAARLTVSPRVRWYSQSCQPPSRGQGALTE